MTRVEPSYFPPLTFGDEMERDDFIQQWFGKHLRSMDEPCLHLEQTCDAVRLLTLPTFHAPRLVRINRDATATRITAKQTDCRGGYGPGRLTVDRTIDAPPNMFDDAISMLNAIGWRKLPTLDDALVLDGTRYVIETTIADEYHVIERASPDRRERELLNWINSHAQSLFPKRWITKR